MNWPTPQDYNEAVQNPSANFHDPELRKAKPDLTKLGLPRPITGNFASVYRMSGNKGQLAVRCFFREFPDMQMRYAAISAHLQATHLPYTVGFQYLGDGVIVRNRPYPLLTMDWADGQLLDDYIRDNLGHSDRLRSLALAWLQMAAELNAHAVAHGDLQHGNVLVRNAELRLVDYDGMYVPALSRSQSLELGHPNYQHPKRDASVFGPWMDNFSHWTIYTSLIALSHDPELWTTLGAGDERLLFGQEDFADPEKSTAFQVLSNHASGEVRALSRKVREILSQSPERIPPLHATQETPGRSATSPLPTRRSWRSTEQASLPASGLPDWLSSFTPRPVLHELPSPGSPPRIVVAALAAVIVVLLSPTISAALPLTTRVDISGFCAVAGTLILTTAYLRHRTVRDRMVFEWCRTQLLFNWRWLEWRASRLTASTNSFERKIEAADTKLHRRFAASQSRRQQQRETILTWVRMSLVPLAESLDQLGRSQQAEIADALLTFCNQVTRSYLRAGRLREASIEHIGWAEKARLWAGGVRTAEDVTASNIATFPWLDTRQIVGLLRWQASILKQSRASLPASLPAEKLERITAPYVKRMARLRCVQKQILLEACPIITAIKIAADSDEHRVSQRRMDLEGSATEHRLVLEAAEASLQSEFLQVREQLLDLDRTLEPYCRLTVRRFLVRFAYGNRLDLIRTKRPRHT